MCALFTKDEKIKLVPQSTESKVGSEYLQKLLNQNIEIPTQQVAEMTPMQKVIQDSLGDYFAGTQQTNKDISNYYSGILNSPDDITQNPEYQGIMKESEILRNQGLTSLRQRSQAGGMLQLSNAVGQEALYNTMSDAQMLKLIGELQDKLNARKSEAAQGLQNVNANQVNQMSAVSNIAEQQRQVEQAKYDAIYNAAIQTVLAPYTYIASIASNLLNYRNDYVATGGGLNDTGMLTSIAANALGAYFGSKAGAAKG